ncbi:ATP-dependent RNA helicase HrpA [Raoultella ornithinolytica]|nr:ATP-dependent RNA helicase HrpA [Raoultella ornithinolytica]
MRRAARCGARRISPRLHDKVRAELNETVVEIAKQVEQILTAVFNINKRLKGRVDMSMALGLSDIKAQMGGLVYRGFVTGNGFRRLGGYSALSAGD